MKKDNEEKVLMIKNNENNKYSKTTEIANEKKSQILKCSTSCHADNHAAEESDHHDDEHESKQEHVVHVVSIMFDRADSDDCLTDVIKRWHEESVWQNENWVCEMKQLKVTWISINNVDDIENNNQQEFWKLHQSTADDEKTELNNDE